MTIDLGPFVSPPRLRGTVFLDQLRGDAWCTPDTVVTETDLPPGAHYPAFVGHVMLTPLDGPAGWLAIANDPDEAVALLRAAGRTLVAAAALDPTPNSSEAP